MDAQWRVGDVGWGRGYERLHYEDFTSSLLTASGRFVVVQPEWYGAHPLVCFWDDGEPKPDPEAPDYEPVEEWCPEESATRVEPNDNRR